MTNFYPEELIEEVRTRNDIVDVVSGYVLLKKTGTSYKGKCPFHIEKTPSFSVSPEKQLYHCFGCGAGGNVISFIMNIENLGFIDALKLLADRAGIILPDRNTDLSYENLQYKKKQIQYCIHKDAAKYFYNNLKNNESVLRYLNSRGISSNTIVKFGLGYALEDWEGLYQFLLNKNYSKEDISKSGLVIPKKTQDSEYYDRFRNRLIFPVFNLTNKIIAFGGRVLDKTLPKYINSPETIIFSKGNNLYGLNKAKNNIKDGQIIIAEGYMDVISLYEHGLDNVVASLGTALTKEQGKILSRYAEEIILAYDGDDAGRQATLRAIEVLIPFECKIKVLILPKGMDPDDYINKFGLTGFLLQIKKALPMVEYKIKLAREKYDLNSTEGKIDFSKEIAEILKNIKSEIEIDAYIQKFSKETGIYESAIKSEVYSHKKRQIKYKTSAQKNRIGNNRNTIEYKINSNRKKSALILAEENLLYAISQDMQVFNKVKKLIDWKDFSLDIHRAIGEIIYNKMNKKEMVIPAQLLNTFNSVQEGRVVSEIFSKNYSKELINKNILEYINTIEIHKLQNKIDKLNKDIKIMNEKGNVDIEKSNETYIELVELKRKLERLKGK